MYQVACIIRLAGWYRQDYVASFATRWYGCHLPPRAEATRLWVHIVIAGHVIDWPILQQTALLREERAQRLLVLICRRAEACAAAHRVTRMHCECTSDARERLQLPE